jgi:hypothetical protein
MQTSQVRSPGLDVRVRIRRLGAASAAAVVGVQGRVVAAPMQASQVRSPGLDVRVRI